MAYSDVSGFLSQANPEYRGSTAQSSHQPSVSNEEQPLGEDDFVQGRIFWLPPKEELPQRAVKRAHGKGAVEEGIYNHPVVILSSPIDEQDSVHFHIITSFQGKRLHEIYGKANEFHASRRSWYLPVSPTPDHPDAVSKKAKKRFPTLELQGNAQLRWNSYVNLRHVYRIHWAYLRRYANPEAPSPCAYHFERESMTRLLSKSRVLIGYEVGEQRQICAPKVDRTGRPNYPSSEGHVEVSNPRTSSRSEGVFLGLAHSPRGTTGQESDATHSVGMKDVDDEQVVEIPHSRNLGWPRFFKMISGQVCLWAQAIAKQLNTLLARWGASECR